MGFSTFEIQGFNSQNVNSILGDQTRVTIAIMIIDFYKALEILGMDKRTDIYDIAISEWIIGNGIDLLSAWEPLIAPLGIKERFKVPLASYPPYLTEMDIIEFSKVPIHILIEEKDNWVTASACEDLVRDLSGSYVDIRITVYANAHHGFYRKELPKKEENGYAIGNFHFRMRSDGALLMEFLDNPIITLLGKKLILHVILL